MGFEIVFAFEKSTAAKFAGIVQASCGRQAMTREFRLRAAIFRTGHASIPGSAGGFGVRFDEVGFEGFRGGKDELAAAAKFTLEQKESVLGGFLEGFEDGRGAGGKLERDYPRFGGSCNPKFSHEQIGPWQQMNPQRRMILRPVAFKVLFGEQQLRAGLAKVENLFRCQQLMMDNVPHRSTTGVAPFAGDFVHVELGAAAAAAGMISGLVVTEGVRRWEKFEAATAKGTL